MMRLLAILLLLALPSQAWAAFSTSDDFDSYGTGDLTGENGGSGWGGAWSGSTAYDVTTAVSQSGANSVIYTDNGVEEQIARSFTAMTSGIISFYNRKTVTSTNADTPILWFTEGATPDVTNRVGGVGMSGVGANAGFFVQSGSTESQVQAYSANTWYKVDIEIDCTTDQYRVSIDDGAFSSWYNFRTTETQIDGLIFYINQSGSTSYSVYWDTIADGEAVAAAPAGTSTVRVYQGRIHTIQGRGVRY